MKKLLFFIPLILVAQLAAAQNNKKVEKDSLKTNTLEEVVLTGQYNPQSVNKSVFEVEVLTQQDIQLLAGNNLADVLTQTLNMNVVPNANGGKTGIQQFGFGSDYVKILVDNVPLIGDLGFGNAIDVSQINLDDIERIEIIEGSMGVQYGANAVTGVVNIITKKSSQNKWEIVPYVQEETVGNEYSWFDEGRHIQSLKLGHNFSDKWYANVFYTRNDFQGFLNDKQGVHYFNTENGNDGLRGYEWLPKEQNSIKSLLNYTNKNFRAFYKFEYFTEKTERYANNVFLNENTSTETFNPTANDEIFRSKRFYHHLNVTGKIKEKVNYNLSASYQEQVINYKQFTYYLYTEEEILQNQYDYNTREGFFSRGTFSNFFNSQKVQTEIGYEVNLDKGTSSNLSEQDISIRTRENRFDTYSLFASAEIKANEKLSFRPGARVITSSMFDVKFPVSLSAKYNFNKGYQLRVIAGTAPKLPTFEQLFYYLVDSNHNVQGNENLNPESGKSVFLHFKKTFWSKDYESKYTPKLSLWYLDVKDKIDLIVVTPTPLAFQYMNIDQYKNWGVTFRNTFKYKNWSSILGLGISGQSKILNAEENYNDDFLYGFQANFNLAYKVPKWNTTFSTFLKYNGPEYQFYTTTNEQDETIFERQKLEGYAWLNASVRKIIFKDLEVTVGARNIADVTRINLSNSQGGAHASGAGSQLLGYGRSYFIKLLYNLNF
ncbi:TonB-dependent siderophore receptor [Mesonia sp. K7]|uniref:TonB-dependent receptor plug domain-containing protein n=1 Tax=Mesonia sp. K7 TaxID=2218606 RepID=UPI000DA70253|nr:TonB-dependent receptor [Mesonia sp. K7]PZD79483.1 TonB-dependent receptor [Mesonia sp. K7]